MHKISSKQILTLSCFLSCFLFPGFGDTLILQTGKNTTVLATLLGMILGIITIFLILIIAKQTTSKNIFELNKERFGYFGYLLNILLVISIVYIIIVATWAIINFVISQFLTRTSYYFILFAMSALVSLAIIKGIEVIGRTSLVLMVFFLITIISSWIFLVPVVNIDNIYPLFDVNKNNFLKTVFMYPTFSAIPLISLLFIKKNNIDDPKNYNKNVIRGYILGSIIVIVFLFLIINIFGIDLAVLFAYPEYTLFKKISILNFIQRVENIVSSIIFIASFMSFTVIMSFLLEYFKSTFKVKNKNKINIIIVAIVFIIPFISVYLFKNYKIMIIYTEYPQYSKYIFMLLLINCLLLVFTKKKINSKN